MSDKANSNVESLLYMAEYHFRESQNNFKAHYFITLAEIERMTLHQRFVLFALKKFIKHTVKPQDFGMTKVNFIEKVIRTEKLMHSIKLDMKNVLKSSAEVWREFKHFNQTPFDSFKNTLESIINTKHQLKEKWVYLEKYLSSNQNYRIYFRWFLKDFLNQEATINEETINEMSGDVEKPVSSEADDFNDPMMLVKKPFFYDTMIVHIRMDTTHPGEITAVGQTCYSFSGYTEKELLRSKINKLMPKVIADQHDKILRQFVQVGMTFIGNNMITTFMKMKNNTLKAVNLLIKLNYQVVGNFEMVGLFREVKRNTESLDYIIVDSNGVSFDILN